MRGPHAIAVPAHCFNRICTQLHAQTPDEDFKCVRISVEVLGVDMLNHLGAAHNDSSAMHQESQQPLLKLGKDDWLAGAHDSSRTRIKLDLAAHEHRMGKAIAATDQRTHACQEFGHHKGLGEIVVSPGVYGGYLIGAEVCRSQDQD